MNLMDVLNKKLIVSFSSSYSDEADFSHSYYYNKVLRITVSIRSLQIGKAKKDHK